MCVNAGTASKARSALSAVDENGQLSGRIVDARSNIDWVIIASHWLFDLQLPCLSEVEHALDHVTAAAVRVHHTIASDVGGEAADDLQVRTHHSAEQHARRRTHTHLAAIDRTFFIHWNRTNYVLQFSLRACVYAGVYVPACVPVAGQRTGARFA